MLLSALSQYSLKLVIRDWTKKRTGDEARPIQNAETELHCKKSMDFICLGHQEMYCKGHFSIPFLNLSWQCMEIWPFTYTFSITV